MKKEISKTNKKKLTIAIALAVLVAMCVRIAYVANKLEKEEKNAQTEGLRYEPETDSANDAEETVDDDNLVWVSSDGQVLTFTGYQYKWENGEDYIQGDYILYSGEDAKRELDKVVKEYESKEKITEGMLDNIHANQRLWKDKFFSDDSEDEGDSVLFLLNCDEGKIDGEDAILLESVYRGGFYTNSRGDGLRLTPLVGNGWIDFDEEKNAGLREESTEHTGGIDESLDLGFDYTIPEAFAVSNKSLMGGGDGAGIMGMTATSKDGKDELQAFVSLATGRYKGSEWREMEYEMSYWFPIIEDSGVNFCQRQIGPVIESAYFFERDDRCYSFTSTNRDALDEFFKSVKFHNNPFKVGSSYYLKTNLRVREAPSTEARQLKTSELKPYYDLEGEDAVFKEGKLVNCTGVKGDWIRVYPNFWICGKEGNNIYLEEKEW